MDFLQNVQVAALEVQNVKRAINRYGTLPKGARIGAYLESLRQGTLSSGQKICDEIPVEDLIGQTASPHPSLRNPSHMIRSNSSGGVTAPSVPVPASPPARGRRPVTGVRNYYPNESLRSGSPSKANPSLADLEFPPPPTDLPPPPDNLPCPPLCFQTPRDESVKKKPRPCKELSGDSFKSKSKLTENKVINDRIEDEDDPHGCFRSTKEMLELKLVCEIQGKSDKKGYKFPKESPSNNGLDTFKNLIGDPAARLVSELSESFNIVPVVKVSERPSDQRVPKDVKAGLRRTGSGANNPLAEKKNSFKPLIKSETNPKVVKKNDSSETIIDFKSRLRKVDTTSANGKKTDADVQSNDDGQLKETDHDSSTETKKTDPNSNTETLKCEEEDDKRRSTGSISSLKKLWEPKESMGDIAASQLSPKLSLKSNNKQPAIEEKNDESERAASDAVAEDSMNNVMTRSLNANSKPVTEKRTWGPDEKPAVPAKPAVKAGKPAFSGKTPGAIYATPVAPIITPIKAIVKDEPKTARENIVDISQALESSIAGMKGNSAVSSSSWLQLSDKVDSFHAACVVYSDDIAPPHQRFQFREVTAKLEVQTRALRSAGARGSRGESGGDGPRLLADVTATVRDAVAALNR